MAIPRGPSHLEEHIHLEQAGSRDRRSQRFADTLASRQGQS